MMLSLASNLPDKQWATGLTLFAGHYYHPGTGANYAGGKSNTAKTNAIDHYENAKATYHTDQEKFIIEVACMLHYLQDICVPHHAANNILPSHGQFEKFADENLNKYIDALHSLSNSEYATYNKDFGDIFDDIARTSLGKIDLVNSISDKSHWDTVAREQTQLAVAKSAVILYKLSVEIGIPLNQG